MRILGISTEIEHELVDDVMFRSETSMLDYDVVLWNPNELIGEYHRNFPGTGTYKGHACLSDDDSARVLKDIVRRKTEMVEMLKLGRSIIIYTPSPEKFYVDTGKREYSGTGRNRQTTRMVTDVELLLTLPVENVQTVEATGSNIEFRGSDPFQAFWRANKDHLYYQAYFQKPVGTPLFYIKGTSKVIGSHIQVTNGSIIFIPAFDIPEENYEEAENTFISSIVTLVNELMASTGNFSLPSWSNNYILPQEKEEKKALIALEQELSELISKISQQKEAILKIEEYKLLFTGSGRALEVQVKKVFSELGFQVTEGIPGRDDLILDYNGRIAVVEIKGVTKSAAEKHAAQLEKWVSEYIASKSITPKGVLIVNTYKDLPVIERAEEDFPNQMIGYSERREHCLITGVQLLSLLLDCKVNPQKKDEIIDKIFSTNGKFADYKNWQDFVNYEATEDKAKEEDNTA